VRMAAVGRTPTFSFAGILSLAAVIARLATTLAFTGIHSFAGVRSILGLIAHLLQRDASLAIHVGGMRLDGERSAH